MAIIDASYKTTNPTVYGNLTSTSVGTGSGLLAYSGFSGTNVIREPYSADLDFGTGEWSASAWVNIPTTLTTTYATNFPVIDTELGYDPNFTDSTKWAIIESTWSIPNNGTAVVSGATLNSGIYPKKADGSGQLFTIVGKSYKLQVTISSLTQGALKLYAGSNFIVSNITVSFLLGTFSVV